VSEYRVVTDARRPDLIDAMLALGASPWPDFLLGHDEVVNSRWDQLYERLPDYQFALTGPDRDDLLASATACPSAGTATSRRCRPGALTPSSRTASRTGSRASSCRAPHGEAPLPADPDGAVRHLATCRRLALRPLAANHERVGGAGAGVALAAMTIRGSVAEWEAWTGLQMPGTGPYLVPGGLVPVEIDRDEDVAVRRNGSEATVRG
jgi:hypothetical protein